MNLERDILLARLVFSTEHHQNGGIEPRVVRISDAKSSCHDIFNPDVNTLQIYGVKVLNLRRSTTTMFDNAAKVLQHSVEVGRALTFDLGLSQTPKFMEAKILYGEINASNQDIDIAHVGPMSITIQRDMPSSWVRTGLTSGMAEVMVRRFYGEGVFACLDSRYSRWDLIEVSHPLSEGMTNYPWILQDPRASGSESVSQGWLCLYGQQPCEMLVRRVASSDEGARICGEFRFDCDMLQQD